MDFALRFVDRVLPGSREAAELVLEVLAEGDERAPLPLPSAPLEEDLERPNANAGVDDTIAVAITDGSGRVVGWTTAKVQR